MMFWSQAERGFYDEDIHGSRSVVIIDPEWQAPRIDVSLQPGESYGGYRNESDQVVVLRDVADLSAEPPVLTQPNPDCRIPGDAVEISRELHAALLAGQARGARIGPGADGHPQLIERTLDEVKEDVWASIRAERDRRTQNGGFQVDGHWYHSDTFSRTQQLGLVMLGAGMPADVTWKTMSGAFVPMTPALAQLVFAAAAASDIAIFAAAEAHKALMTASADPAAYDFSGGWPLAFGEEA